MRYRLIGKIQRLLDIIRYCFKGFNKLARLILMRLTFILLLLLMM